MTIELDYDILHDAALFASTDITRPTLTGVHIYTTGGWLTVEATDSYTAYRRTHEYDKRKQCDLIIPGNLIRRLPKPRRTEPQTVNVMHANNAITLTTTWGDYLALTMPAPDPSEYPNIVKVWPVPSTVNLREPLTLAPRNLARIHKMRGPLPEYGATLAHAIDALGPTEWKIRNRDDSYSRILIMPIRLTERTGE